MSDQFTAIFSMLLTLVFSYFFFYRVCYRYILRPLLHSMGLKGKAMPATHHLQGTGKYSFPIVGESFYQRALDGIAGPKNPAGVDMTTIASVVLDDFNRHDNKAVRVEIDGQVIGHFSKENARKYRDWLKSHGINNATCAANARITGGWQRGSGEGDYGVSLDFVMSKEPLVLQPEQGKTF